MRIQLGAALLMAVLLTGCGGAGSATGGGSVDAKGTGSGPVAQQVNMTEIQGSVSSAQTALTNAQSALNLIFSSNGTFNWLIFLGGVNFSTLGANTQTCIQNAFPNQNIAALFLTLPNDIATALGCVFNDVVTVASGAETDLNNALSILNTSLAALPSGSSEAAEVQSMITEVQTLQANYSTSLFALASQLSPVTSFLQTLPTLATSVIPIPIVSLFVGMTISSYVQPITAKIMTFQSQLEAL